MTYRWKAGAKEWGNRRHSDAFVQLLSPWEKLTAAVLLQTLADEDIVLGKVTGIPLGNIVLEGLLFDRKGKTKE